MVRAPQDEAHSTLTHEEGLRAREENHSQGRLAFLVREPGVDGDGPFLLFSHVTSLPSTPRHQGRRNLYIDHARHRSDRHTHGNTRTDENPPLR
jgi:hypothetical protein